MVSIGEVVADLRRVADLLPFACLADALEAVEEAHAHIQQVAIGSGQDEFFQVLDWFEKTRDGISDLQQRLSAIQSQLNTLTNRLEGGTATATPPTTVAKPSARIRERAAELLDLLPVRSPANRKTSGYWIDENGREHGPLTSGRDEHYEPAVEILRRLGISPARGTLTTADHVEVKLAARLRTSAHQHVTLAVNNAPCSQGRFSCERVLPLILRPGQSITIYWPDGVMTCTGRTL